MREVLKAMNNNTKYAQGGVAVVNDLEKDSFEKHIDDTLIAGDGLCNREVVEIVVSSWSPFFLGNILPAWEHLIEVYDLPPVFVGIGEWT